MQEEPVNPPPEPFHSVVGSRLCACALCQAFIRDADLRYAEVHNGVTPGAWSREREAFFTEGA